MKLFRANVLYTSRRIVMKIARLRVSAGWDGASRHVQTSVCFGFCQGTKKAFKINTWAMISVSSAPNMTARPMQT